jgi:hypothetical protein
MFDASLNVALRCSVRAVCLSLAVACASSHEDTSRASPVLAAGGSDFADAGPAASLADCELMTCPASRPARVLACNAVEILQAADLTKRAVLAVTGSTRTARDTSQSEFGSCAGSSSGPDAWYQLDLSHASEPLELQAALDARFDAAIDLRRGPCGDTQSIACDRAVVLGSPSSTLTARLEPGVYWLVVDGANAASAGDFRLQVELDPLVGCSSPPPNQSCETAAQLEPLERQTVLLDEACAVEAGSDAALYYELDLSAEVGPVLASVVAWSIPQPYFQYLTVYPLDANSPRCGTRMVYSYLGSGVAQRTGAELQILLSPGRYVVEVEPGNTPLASHAALSLKLDREACAAGPVGNDCTDALDDIDPTAASQVVAGSTACNANRRTLLPCALEGEDSPEQIHRLDLRGASGVTRARLTVLVDGLTFLPLLALFSAAANGECGDTLYCDDRIERAEGPPHVDLMLEPALYFVGVDGGDLGLAGAYRLLVELEPAEPNACVTAQIDECMFWGNRTIDCCREWSPLCSQKVALCGLSPATQACVCAANPACCESNLLPPDCNAAQLACNYLCPDFASSDFTCVGAVR